MSKNGLLLIDKSSGMTSHDVVAKARRILRNKEIGHAGTLDPLASGLMVLLLGEATKISDYVLTGDKRYFLKVRFGVQTDTLDMTGQILKTFDLNRTREDIVHAAESLVGEFQWNVPMYSAAKIDGRKMYEMARAGEKIEQPTKLMSFFDLKITSVEINSLEAEISCSKGSFIRTWADELGKALGIGGTIEVLRRIHSTPYDIQNALSLEQLETLVSSGEEWGKAFIPLHKTLPGWRTVTVRGKDQRLMNNGQISHDLERRLIEERRLSAKEMKTVGIKILSAESGELVSILEAQPGRGLKIRRVFRNLPLAAPIQN